MTMINKLTRPLPIWIYQYGLQERSLILMIIVVYLRVDHNCKYLNVIVRFIFYYINCRLIKEACTRMLESSSSPYDTFVNNSIQLVHLAKVTNRLFIYLLQDHWFDIFRLTWKHFWWEHSTNRWAKPLIIHQFH